MKGLWRHQGVARLSRKARDLSAPVASWRGVASSLSGCRLNRSEAERMSPFTFKCGDAGMGSSSGSFSASPHVSQSVAGPGAIASVWSVSRPPGGGDWPVRHWTEPQPRAAPFVD